MKGEKMNPKYKMIIQIIIVILIVVLSSFITKRSESWFKPTTEIIIVFEDSKFPGMPKVDAIKDKTTYRFLGCDFTGRKFGEYISPSEVDRAIDKLDKMGGKK